MMVNGTRGQLNSMIFKQLLKKVVSIAIFFVHIYKLEYRYVCTYKHNLNNVLLVYNFITSIY